MRIGFVVVTLAVSSVVVPGFVGVTMTALLLIRFETKAGQIRFERNAFYVVSFVCFCRNALVPLLSFLGYLDFSTGMWPQPPPLTNLAVDSDVIPSVLVLDFLTIVVME